MAKNCSETPSLEDLEKEAGKLYNAKKAEEQKLLDLYANNKLKNKNTIRKARIIANEYAKKDNKKA